MNFEPEMAWNCLKITKNGLSLGIWSIILSLEGFIPLLILCQLNVLSWMIHRLRGWGGGGGGQSNLLFVHILIFEMWGRKCFLQNWKISSWCRDMTVRPLRAKNVSIMTKIGQKQWKGIFSKFKNVISLHLLLSHFYSHSAHNRTKLFFRFQIYPFQGLIGPFWAKLDVI